MKNFTEFLSSHPLVVHLSIGLFLGILIFQFITSISLNGNAARAGEKVLETLVVFIIPLIFSEAVVLYIISNIYV